MSELAQATLSQGFFATARQAAILSHGFFAAGIPVVVSLGLAVAALSHGLFATDQQAAIFSHGIFASGVPVVVSQGRVVPVLSHGLFATDQLAAILSHGLFASGVPVVISLGLVVPVMSHGLFGNGSGNYAVVTDVRVGVDRGDGEIGTLTLPTASDVREGIDYGGDGTELEGTLVVATVTVPVAVVGHDVKRKTELWLVEALTASIPSILFVPTKGGGTTADAAVIEPPYCAVESIDSEKMVGGENTWLVKVILTYVTHIDDTATPAHVAAVRTIYEVAEHLPRGFKAAQTLLVHGTDITATESVEDSEGDSHGDTLTLMVGVSG